MTTSTPIYDSSTPPKVIGTNVTGSCSGTHYKVMPWQATLTLKCSPVVNIGTSNGAANASVVYSTSVSPVTITPSGATLNSSGYNILVGQGCTSSLTGIPTNCSVSNWQWGVTGSTFQSWTVSADQSHTTEVDGPGRSDQPTAHWFWNDNLGKRGSKVEKIICTATVTPPVGQGSAFTVSATTPVTVWVPDWTCKGIGGAIYVINEGSGDYWLQAGSSASPNNGPDGMVWAATIASPLLGTFGDGTIALVQLAIPGRTKSAAGYDYWWSTNGQAGLDTSYPYRYSWAHPWTPQEPYYADSDDPGFSLPETPQTSPASSASLQDQFEDTLLYTPPGSSQCVPLAKFVWTTNGHAVEPLLNGTYSWAFYGSGSAGTVTPTGTQPFVQINAFPMWTQNSGNGAGYWME